MNRSNLVIVSACILLASFIVGALAFKANEKNDIQLTAQTNAQALARTGAASFGNPAAKVHIVEFFDPACETCRAFYPYVKNLVNFSGDKVRVTMRYAPFHHGSDYVVKALEAARMQDKYWPAVEAVLAAQPDWANHEKPEPQRIWDAMQVAGVDIDKAQQDMNHPAIAKLLEQDMVDVAALKVERTPSFFVNGKPLVEFGREQLSALVQAEIQTAYTN